MNDYVNMMEEKSRGSSMQDYLEETEVAMAIKEASCVFDEEPLEPSLPITGFQGRRRFLTFKRDITVNHGNNRASL
jgi:hypothetical protein